MTKAKKTAELVVFLASDRASAITGSEFVIDEERFQWFETAKKHQRERIRI